MILFQPSLILDEIRIGGNYLIQNKFEVKPDMEVRFSTVSYHLLPKGLYQWWISVELWIWFLDRNMSFTKGGPGSHNNNQSGTKGFTKSKSCTSLKWRMEKYLLRSTACKKVITSRSFEGHPSSYEGYATPYLGHLTRPHSLCITLRMHFLFIFIYLLVLQHWHKRNFW